MRTKSPLLLLIATAGLFSAFAFAANKLTDGTTAPASHPLHHPPPSAHPAVMKAYHEKVLATYDVDKNGTLDVDEHAVLQDDIRAGKFPAPQLARRHAAHHVGLHPELPPELLARYDTNKDGKLDEAEHAVLAADIAAGKVQPPRRRHPPAAPPAKEN